MSEGGAGLVRGDALHLPLANESVDLIVTSPPYFALRSYQDDGGHYDGQIGSEATPREFLEALWAVTRESVRVLKPSGSMFVNLGDKYSQRVATRASSHQDGLFPDRPELRKDWKRDRELGLARMPADNLVQTDSGLRAIREKSLMGLPWRYAIGCIDQLDLILRAEIVWSKPNGLPESVTDRVRRSHEQFFHFVKQGRYYSAVDEIREEFAPGSVERIAQGFQQNTRAETGNHSNGMMRSMADGQTTYTPNPLGKLPGSVWTIPTEPLQVPDWLGVDHFAAFPQEFPRRIILGWSPPGICVECGEGRRPIVDVEHDQFRQALSTGRPKSQHPGKVDTSGRSAAGYPYTKTATITGYSCACPDATAPTRPAVVLDPFCGTGTVPMVARALGRYGIGVDLSSDYLRLARWRVFESGHDLKTVERTHGPTAARSVEQRRTLAAMGQEAMF